MHAAVCVGNKGEQGGGADVGWCAGKDASVQFLVPAPRGEALGGAEATEGQGIPAVVQRQRASALCVRHARPSASVPSKFTPSACLRPSPP
jgi:hypothetical protein